MSVDQLVAHWLPAKLFVAGERECGFSLTLNQKIHIIQWNYYEITAGKDYG